MLFAALFLILSGSEIHPSASALRVVPESRDLGRVVAGTETQTSIWLINDSDEPLTIDAARTTCGCLKPTFDGITLGPRQAVEVAVALKAPREQQRWIDQPLRFYQNDQFLAQAHLQIQSVHPHVAQVAQYFECSEKEPQRKQEFLAEDSRLWFGERKGAGTLRSPEGKGPWSEWDQELNSVSRAEMFENLTEAEVRVTVSETNDFYRLLGERPRSYHITYTLDDQDKIAGTLISGIPGTPPVESRPRFEDWAHRTHPEKAAQVFPDGRLAPSKENALLCKELLIDWRKAEGLAEIKLRKNR